MSQSPPNDGLDALSTVDSDGARIYLHPSEVDGRFHRWRRRFQAVLLAFYVILPWITIGGRQGMLLDISHREFALFGLHFRADDVPLLLFPALGFTFLAAFVTALFGRVWCGWACPQTVFIEAVFRRIETWIEGGPLQRRRLDREPFNARKLIKRTAKWSAFLLVALLITHTALALFIGRDRLLRAIQRPPVENWEAFLFIALATLVILVDFGWLREQFCLLACPYGRIQSLFVDRHTRTILYDERRGEPRKGRATPHGDCVNCLRCVQVCPTGIDIRRGPNQLECIGCTACIDACDEVMAKIHKPCGLIRYDSEAAAHGETSPWWRPRIALYTAALAGLVAVFVGVVGARRPLSLTILKTRGEPFERVSGPDGSPWIANAFHAEVTNRAEGDREIRFQLPPRQTGMRLVIPGNPFVLHAGEIRQIPFVVEAAQSGFRDGTLKARLEILSGEASAWSQEITLVGPYR